MESERPCCYTEYCDPLTSWEEIGMRIKWTKPAVPGESEMPMLDPLYLRLCLECKKPVPIREVTVWAWTHVFHQDNPEGIYREIKMEYNPRSRHWNDWGQTTYEFGTIIFPSHVDKFRLTYNVKYRDMMLWANLFQIDHILTVTLPRDINIWTKTPRIAQITDNMYLGNFLAVLLAEEHGFDAVLSLNHDAQVDLDSRIVREGKLTDLDTGAGHEISEDHIKEVVDWLRHANLEFSKILIGDRDGQGRVGSVMTAYIFANNRNLTFEEAYDYVRTRMPLYCHRGLKRTLYELYPRD